MQDNERAPKEHPWKVSYCVARHSFRVEDLFSRTSAIGEGVLYTVYIFKIDVDQEHSRGYQGTQACSTT